MTEGLFDLTLHPWNTAFAWEPPTGPFRVLDEAQAAAFDRDGFVVLRDVFEPAAIAALREEVDRHEAEVDAALRRTEQSRVLIAEADAITFTTHLVTRSPRAREFAAHPVLVGLCHDTIGADVNLYWDQAVYKKPQKPRRFPWHQDNGYAFVRPQQYLTCWIPLTPATLANGCPQVALGMHRRGTLHHTYVDPLGWQCFEDPGEVVVAEADVGDVVVFSSLTPHLTGPNTTDAVRKAWIVQYAPAGASILVGDPASDEEPRLVPADVEDRQFAVLRDGVPTVILSG